MIILVTVEMFAAQMLPPFSSREGEKEGEPNPNQRKQESEKFSIDNFW